MKVHWGWFPLLVLALGAESASGQQGRAVQLPTFSFFGGSTTVSVPDRGSAYFGGVHRARSGMNEFGVPLLPFRPFRSRAFGSKRRASDTSVSAYVHDFEAMDRYLLSRPTSSRAAQPRVAGGRPQADGPSASAPDVWQKRLAAAQATSGGKAVMSVARLRAQHLREEQARQEEALKWFERGRQAQASGKAGVARVYYQMAARRATGTLKDQIAARVASLSGSPATPRLVESQPERP